MKLLILILLTLPQLIFAGWVKEGNGFISEYSLVGQKRFLPEENAVIVESKDYVLKFDLTTGEIIKRIDIVETDLSSKLISRNEFTNLTVGENLRINISGLTSGTYIFNFVDNGKVFSTNKFQVVK